MSLELARQSLKIVDSPVTRKENIRETQPLEAVIKQYVTERADLVVWQRQQILWGCWDGAAFVFANHDAFDENQIL